MKKHFLYIAVVLLSVYSYGSVESLKNKIFNFYFNKELWDSHKKDFKNKLLNGDINDSVIFSDRKFEGLDFSGLSFCRRTFTNCQFKNINFEGSDLRDIKVENCEFIKNKFTGALLYCSKETSTQELWTKGFKFPNYQCDSDLLQFYSDLMNKIDSRENIDLLEYAMCLNNFFPLLRLSLNGNYKGLNLRNINLSNANLYNSHFEEAVLIKCNLQNAFLKNSKLQKAWITEDIQVPDYPEDDRTELFKKWIKSTPEEENFYQFLVNAQFDLFTGVASKLLRESILLKRDLRNADLFYAYLKGIDLSHKDLRKAALSSQLERANLSYSDLRNVNLYNACLEEANLSYADLQGTYLKMSNLKGAKLIGCNLQNVKLEGAKIQKAWITDEIQVPDYPEDDRTELFKKWIKSTPEEENFYQSLVNARFDLFKGVALEFLHESISSKKDLRNANLRNIHLNLYNAHLRGVDLSHANLQNAKLVNIHLEGTSLSYSDLQNTDLRDAYLQEAKLIGCNLQNAKLEGAKLQRAWITDEIQIPDYDEDDKTELFKKWIKSTPEEENFYQSLVNGGFDLFSGVAPEILRKGISVKKNLKNAYLTGIHLKGANLSHVNLKRANLINTHLKGANLNHANLKYTLLRGARLQGANLVNAKIGVLLYGWMCSPLPKDCTDEDLLKIYRTCNDDKEKSILREILIAKQIPMDTS